MKQHPRSELQPMLRRARLYARQIACAAVLTGVALAFLLISLQGKKNFVDGSKPASLVAR